MEICVVGAGAIGGLLGVKLALAGHAVTLSKNESFIHKVDAGNINLGFTVPDATNLVW